MIIEPLPANYGLLPQRPEWLAHVAELCRNSGALLILDEVISGFRAGSGGMAQELGLTPDLVTYGKVIGGGFPVAAYAGRGDLMDLVAPVGPVYQAGTLSANPVGMRAGLATLSKMDESDGWNVLGGRTARFCDELRAGFADADLPIDINVVQHASIFWLHPRSDQRSDRPAGRRDSVDTRRVVSQAVSRGAGARGVSAAFRFRSVFPVDGARRRCARDGARGTGGSRDRGGRARRKHEGIRYFRSLCVLRLRLEQDGDVRIGVLPECKELGAGTPWWRLPCHGSETYARAC